jgi:arylsulfatase
VLPLDNRSLPRFLEPRPSAHPGVTEFSYTSETSHIPKGGAPSVLDRSFIITAEVEIPASGGDGMLVTDGGRFGGYGLYILKGKPVFTYNFVNVERTRWEGKEALSPGRHTIVFDFKYDGIGFGLGGHGTLSVNGKTVDAKRIARTIPFTLPVDETFDVGVDTRTPVDDRDYKVPFRFQGKLTKVTVKQQPLKGTLAQIIAFKLATRD